MTNRPYNTTVRFNDTLMNNCWLPLRNKSDTSVYETTIKLDNKIKCYANITTRFPLRLDGHYGVQWIDVEYIVGAPYGYSDLQELMKAIEIAENNLLTIGVPFTEGYVFHGEDKDEKAQKNEHIRQQWNLAEVESEYEEK